MTDITQQFITQTLTVDPDLKKIFNWDVISKMPLTSEFIDAQYYNLVWPIISEFQALTPEIVKKYESMIDFALMSKNKNLPSVTVEAFLDKMDWDKVQVCHKFTSDMLEKHKDDFDTMVILKHQTLTESMINSILNPLRSDMTKWDMLREYLKLVVTCQKVSENFIKFYS